MKFVHLANDSEAFWHHVRSRERIGEDYTAIYYGPASDLLTFRLSLTLPQCFRAIVS